MTDTLDPGGNFPVQDGVTQVTSTNTPVGFDLVQLLSESMRSRPAWLSMAQVTSNVLYQYFEQQRIALELSRDPKHLSRVLKIATLKMLGLDWQSDYVSDDAYDRLLESVSLYMQSHGTNDFVNYIGYALGFQIEMAPLWSQDYNTFVPGPQSNNIFNSPPGPWYPTSHVALLYEEYADNLPTADDLTALQDVFYRIAPIHLVLQAIGTIVTSTIGPLYACVLPREIEIEEAICEYVPEVSLSYNQNTWEETVDIAVCQPLYPNREIDATVAAFAIDSGFDGAQAYSTGVGWSTGMSLQYSGLTVVGGYDVPSTHNSLLSLSLPFNIDWGYASGEGLLMQRSLTQLLSSSGDPLSSNWGLYGVNVVRTFTRYDGDLGCTVTNLYEDGTVVSSVIATGTDCVMFAFRPGTSGAVMLSRGNDSIMLTIDTMALTPSEFVTNYGVYPIGAGFYVLWAVMTGSFVTVTPCVDGFGSIDWLDCQVLQGSNYPAPVPSTGPSIDAVELDPGDFTQANSLVTQIEYQQAVDFGFVPQTVELAADFGFVTSPPAHLLDAGVMSGTIIDQLLGQEAIDLGGITFVLGNPPDLYTQMAMDPVLDLGYVVSTAQLSVDLEYGETTLMVDLGGVPSSPLDDISLGTVTGAVDEVPFVPFVYVGYTNGDVEIIDDLGSVADPVITDAVDLGVADNNVVVFNPANVFDYLGGVAEVGLGEAPLTLSVLTNLIGSSVALDITTLNQACGFVLLRALPIFVEWELDGPQSILQMVNNTTSLAITVSTAGVEVTLGATTNTLPIPDGALVIGIIWNTSGTTVYVNGASCFFATPIANLSSMTLFGGTVPSSTWLIERIVAVGGNTQDTLPSASFMQLATGGVAYQIENDASVDLGDLASTAYLAGDFGPIIESATIDADLGVA